MVFMHHPLWKYPHDGNFSKIEALLQGKDYTVFAGHQHQYHHSEQHDANYYVLATTGGGSPLLGNSFGSFDHITWVTMSDQGPVLANLRLDGILPHDVSNEETHALTAHLIQSINVETHVLVDSEKEFRSGTAFITYSNSSDQALYLNGEFFHSHHVVATPSKIKATIPPKSSRTIEIQLKAIKPFGLEEKVFLEYTGSIGYKSDQYPDLKLSGKVNFPILNATYDLMTTEYVEFVDAFTIQMRNPLPGTTIRYTQDGTEPNTQSPIYNKPIEIGESQTIKARLFTKNEIMKSNVVELKAKQVKAGEGLLVAHYPYNRLARSTGLVPEFSKTPPKRITATTELDPVKVFGDKDQFGLVYKGNIELKESGEYTFKAISDDGIKILINDQRVVSDFVKHKARLASGKIKLKKGKHKIEIQFFQWKRAYALDIEVISPSGRSIMLTSENLSYDQNTFKDE